MILVRGSIVALAFANSVITARLLMPSGRGQYAIIMAGVSLYAFIASSPGTGVALAVAHGGPTEVARAVAAGTVLALCAGTAAIIGAVFWPSSASWRTPLVVASIALPFLLIVNIGQYVCLGADKLRLLAATQVAQAVISTVGGFFLIGPLHGGLVGATTAWFLSWAIVSIISAWTLRTVDWRLVRLTSLRAEVVSLLRFGLGSAVPGSMTFLTNRSLLVLVQSMLGLSSVGVYSLALSMAEPVTTVATGTAITAYPRLVSSESRAKRTRQFLQLTLIASVVLGLCVYSLALGLLIPIFGSAYASAIHPLPVLLLAYAFASGRDIVSYYYMHEASNVRIPAISAAVGFLVTLAAAVPLVGEFQLVGAALATLMGTSVTLLGMLIGMRRYGIRPLDLFHLRPAEVSELRRVLRSAGWQKLLAWARH